MTIAISRAIRRRIQVITKTRQNGSWQDLRTLSLLYALGATLAVLAWQAATVHFNYGGNWTALFMTGEMHPAPPILAGGTYVFQGSTGYDGQFYRYVAHAPWLRGDWFQYYDDARLRHYRILVPGLAWVLALGQQGWVDRTYIALILGWVFLGTYWLARYAGELRHRPVWGLAFLLLPATMTSIDRMTVDVAIAALCVAFVRYARRGSDTRLYIVLVLAALVRETGAFLIVAVCLHALSEGRWRRAAGFATAILPAAAWYAFIWNRAAMFAANLPQGHLHGARFLPRWFFRVPGVGLLMKLFQPDQYPFGPGLNHLVQALDALALCGMLAMIAIAVWSLRRRPWDVEQWTIVCFLGLVLATSVPGFWGQVYGYTRPFSPLIFLAVLRPLRNGSLWVLGPLLFIVLRVVVQLTPQAMGIARGLL